MLNTVRAVVRQGKIEVVEPVDLPEGKKTNPRHKKRAVACYPRYN